jgi:hypothetical protein
MTSCADVLVTLDFEMEDSKKPPTQRLAVNAHGSRPKIVFYTGEVEAQAATQGFSIGLFNCPQLKEGSECGVFTGRYVEEVGLFSRC